MKKVALAFILAVLIFLSGCKWSLPWNRNLSTSSSSQSTTSIQNNSPDNLIPIGEYGQIGYDNMDVQLKITEIMSGDDICG